MERSGYSSGCPPSHTASSYSPCPPKTKPSLYQAFHPRTSFYTLSSIRCWGSSWSGPFSACGDQVPGLSYSSSASVLQCYLRSLTNYTNSSCPAGPPASQTSWLTGSEPWPVPSRIGKSYDPDTEPEAQNPSFYPFRPKDILGNFCPNLNSHQHETTERRTTPCRLS